MKTTTKKITKATFKAFIKKNLGCLFTKVTGDYDPMQDCRVAVHGGFVPAEKTDSWLEHSLGVEAVHLVGGSRDYFTEYEDDVFVGIRWSNCCGSGVIATQKKGALV